MKDYYKILGLNATASPEDIHARWIELMLKFHPDRGSNGGAEDERVREINEAYGVLKHPSGRAHYDLERTYHRKKRNLYLQRLIVSPIILIVLLILGVIYFQRPHQTNEIGETNETDEIHVAGTSIPSVLNDLNLPNAPNVTNDPNDLNVSNAPNITNDPNDLNVSNAPNITNDPNALNAPNVTNNLNDPNALNDPNITTDPNDLNALNAPNDPNVPNVLNPPNVTNDPNDQNALNALNETDKILIAKPKKPPKIQKALALSKKPRVTKTLNVPNVPNVPNVLNAPNITNDPNEINQTDETDETNEKDEIAQLTPTPLIATEEEVKQFFAQYRERYNQNDIEGFLSLFSSRAVQNQRDGFDEIKEIYSKFFDQSRELSYHMEDTRIQIYQNAVEVWARYKIDQTSKRGGRKRVWMGDIRWILLKENGDLKIRFLDFRPQESP